MKSDFKKILRQSHSPANDVLHPFSQAWIAGDLTRAQLGKWAVQHYYFIEPIARQLALLFSRLPDPLSREQILENILGEEDPEERQIDLLLEFAGHCGVDTQNVLLAELRGEILPSTRAMRSWVWELVSIRSLAEGTAGILVGLESQTIALYPLYMDRLLDMGFDEDQLQFFRAQTDGNSEAAEKGIEVVMRYATTPELTDYAVAAVNASRQLRWAYLSGMYRAIVLGEDT